MSDINLRLEALRLAVATGAQSGAIVPMATSFFAFLAQADAPASAESAPRLDDPKVVAATKKVIAADPKPEPTGSTTASSDATSSGSEASAETAAPTADEIATLRAAANDAVLTAVKPDKLGRDPTVAILKKHGGAKVPEIPVENLAALTAELNIAMASK